MGRKFTYEEVKEYVESNSDCILLSTEYKTIKSILKFQCGCKDKHIFYTSFEKFKNRNKRQCNLCSNKIRAMKKTLTYEQVKNYIETNSNCKLISEEYKGVRKKLLLKCGCEKGNLFEMDFNVFKKSSHKCCNECLGKLLKYNTFTYDEVKNFIETNSNSKLISTSYLNMKSLLKFKCSCGKYFETTFSGFKWGGARQCKVCGRKLCAEKTSLNYEDVKNYINSIGSELLSESYINSTSKLKIRCRSCKKAYYQTFTDFKASKNKICLDCFHKLQGEIMAFTYEEVKKYIETSSNCKLLSKEYINMKEKIKILCGECGEHIFETTLNSFKNGDKTSCDSCSGKISNIEDKIQSFLISNNIKFIPQYRFDDCKNVNTLPFDFYLKDYNIAIEADGEGHYFPVQFGGISQERAEENFKQQLFRDKIKTNYCKNNDIRLLRISYTEFNNIETILSNYLS